MKSASLALLACWGCMTGIPVCAQDFSLQEFLGETQRMEQSTVEFKLVWWIPTQYWKESFRNAPNMTEFQKEEFYKAVDGYFVLALVDAKVSTLGAVTPKSREELIAALSVTTSRGVKLQPLQESEMSPDTINLFAVMKPLLGNMLGQFGKGIEFICFTGKDAQGELLMDPTKEGSFSIDYGGKAYKWRLPLGSLLPPMFDPETGEGFPGNYQYNPYTGQRLVARSPKDPD